MNILMLDTSGPACGVALMRDGALVYEAQLTHAKTHSQQLMPMMDAALDMSGLRAADIDLFGAVVGPGSFTGVRIGVTTVKALSQAACKPCIGIDALEALAANVNAFDGLVCPILDARAQQVYGAAFRAGFPPVRVFEDEAEKLTRFLDKLEAINERALFVGDGVNACREAIAARMGERASFAPAHQAGLRAGSACALAAHYAEHEPQRLTDYVQLMPLYLRAPQAERERAAKQAAAAAGEKTNG